MDTIFLCPVCYNRVVTSSSHTVVQLLTTKLFIGEQVRCVDVGNNEVVGDYNFCYRYVKEISHAESFKNNEVLCFVTLVDAPVLLY